MIDSYQDRLSGTGAQGPVSSFFKVLLAEDVYILSIYTVNAPKTFKKHDTGPCGLAH